MDLNELLNNLEPNEIYVCSQCGSPDIERKEWVNVNTGMCISQDDSSEIWCNNCNDFTHDMVTLEKYEKTNNI